MGRAAPISISGVSLEPLTPENRFKFDVPPTTKGVVVTKSSGEAETFKEGVVIVEINGVEINDVKDVGKQLKKEAIGFMFGTKINIAFCLTGSLKFKINCQA